MKILVVVLTFVWVGLVLGISFLEAPLKFQAPNITLPLGLGIGRLVFGALNKVEWVFTLGIILSFWRGHFSFKVHYLYGFAFGILALQTLWLIPILDARAGQIIAGETPPPTYHHIGFIVVEFCKVAVLLAAGVVFLRKIYADAPL